MAAKERIWRQLDSIRIQENKAKPEKQKSGFAKRLEDAMRQQQAMKSNKEQQTKKKK